MKYADTTMPRILYARRTEKLGKFEAVRSALDTDNWVGNAYVRWDRRFDDTDVTLGPRWRPHTETPPFGCTALLFFPGTGAVEVADYQQGLGWEANLTGSSIPKNRCFGTRSPSHRRR